MTQGGWVGRQGMGFRLGNSDSSMHAHVEPQTSGHLVPLYNVLHGESSKRLATPRNTKDKKHLQSTLYNVYRHTLVQWSEDVIKAEPFFGRSRVRLRVPPWVSNIT